VTELTAREVIDRFVEAAVKRDFEGMGALVAPDFVEDYPQSGEIVRGRENFVALLQTYPGGLAQGAMDRDDVRTVGVDERWVMTPTFTVVRVEGSGETYTVSFRVRYPDDSTWYLIGIRTIKGGLIQTATTYFAPLFDPPPWRSHLVELKRDHEGESDANR
jgi:hypothetical protein